MTTSKTGNKFLSRRGLTFIEVMATVVILSIGLITVFRAYVNSLNHLKYLTNNFYALIILNDRLSQIERDYKISHSLPLDIDQYKQSVFKEDFLEYKENITFAPVDVQLKNLFKVTCTIIWQERGQTKTISATTYISDWIPS